MSKEEEMLTVIPNPFSSRDNMYPRWTICSTFLLLPNYIGCECYQLADVNNMDMPEQKLYYLCIIRSFKLQRLMRSSGRHILYGHSLV